MDKLILTKQNVTDLLAWRDTHKEEIMFGAAPVKNLEIHTENSNVIIKCFRDGDNLKLHFNIAGKSRGYALLKKREDGMWIERKNTTNMPKNSIMSGLTLYASAMAVMAFHSPKPVQSETNEHTTPKQNPKDVQRKPTERPAIKSNDITYILHQTKYGLTALPKGSHASPNGVFPVRGHFRHYKSGKVVWIESYQKGTGKNRKRTYKIAKNAFPDDTNTNIS